MTSVAIALGSNLGDRQQHVAWAADRLRALLDHARVSAVVETEPFGVSEPQPPYLNAVIIGETALEPGELMAELLALERARGRERPAPLAPRTLDLDLILYGDRVVAEADLAVPHPRFRERRFVLEPLAELAPAWRDPVTGKSVATLLGELRS